jgi:Protein of unknown function VcgC/VcgE (DUF2780)
MKIIVLLSTCFSMSISLFLANHVHALDFNDFSGAAGTLQKGAQVLEVDESATTTVPTKTSGLAGLLMQQLGVSQLHAEGGAGALFQLAKSRMSTGDFTTLSKSVPEMKVFLAAAPPASPLGGGGMAATFLEIGLKPDMVQKFIPIMLEYVEGSGGSTVAAALKSALMGGM